MSIPYANLLQALRLAAEAAKVSVRDEWKRAAFVGWQLQSAVVGALGGKGSGKPFGSYLEALGFERERVHVEPSTKRASDNAAKVREAFRRHGVTRGE